MPIFPMDRRELLVAISRRIAVVVDKPTFYAMRDEAGALLLQINADVRMSATGPASHVYVAKAEWDGLKVVATELARALNERDAARQEAERWSRLFDERVVERDHFKEERDRLQKERDEAVSIVNGWVEQRDEAREDAARLRDALEIRTAERDALEAGGVRREATLTECRASLDDCRAGQQRIQARLDASRKVGDVFKAERDALQVAVNHNVTRIGEEMQRATEAEDLSEAYRKDLHRSNEARDAAIARNKAMHEERSATPIADAGYRKTERGLELLRNLGFNWTGASWQGPERDGSGYAITSNAKMNELLLVKKMIDGWKSEHGGDFIVQSAERHREMLRAWDEAQTWDKVHTNGWIVISTDAYFELNQRKPNAPERTEMTLKIDASAVSDAVDDLMKDLDKVISEPTPVMRIISKSGLDFTVFDQGEKGISVEYQSVGEVASLSIEIGGQHEMISVDGGEAGSAS